MFSIRLLHKTATPFITQKRSVELRMRPLPSMPGELKIENRVSPLRRLIARFFPQ